MKLRIDSDPALVNGRLVFKEAVMDPVTLEIVEDVAHASLRSDVRMTKTDGSMIEIADPTKMYILLVIEMPIEEGLIQQKAIEQRRADIERRDESRAALQASVRRQQRKQP